MKCVSLKLVFVLICFIGFCVYSQINDSSSIKKDISTEIAANEILQDEYCTKNINRELCADVSVKIAQLYYSRGKQNKNRDDFQKAADICCVLIQSNIDVETTVKVNNILDLLKNENINTAGKKKTVLSQVDVNDQYKAIAKPETAFKKQEGEKTHFMWGAAFIMSGITGSLNHSPDTIICYKDNNQTDTVVPDYSHLGTVSNLKGFSVILEVCNIGKTIIGARLFFLDFLFSKSVNMYQGYFDVYLKIPLIKNHLWIPIGAGIKAGSLWFDWEYANEYESMNRKIPVEKTNSSGNMTRFEFGFQGFGGLRLRLGKSPIQIFAEAGYSFHPNQGTWSFSYKTGEKDNNGNDEYESINVPDKYLPYKDVRIMGLHVKVGFLIGSGKT